VIPLPPSITADRDIAAEESLVERARQWLSADDRKEGIHASDLLKPRQAYFKHVDPRPWSAREVGLFLVGKVLHAFILSDGDATGVDVRATDEGSTYSEELGLWYSPDHVGDDIPVELKTSRAQYPPKSIGDMETYLQQLLIYMAAKKKTEGRLVVFYISARDEARKTSPKFEVYDVRITQEELEATTYEVRRLRNELSDALVAKKFDRLPLCPAWLCHPEQCPYWNQCKPPGRYDNRAYLEGKRK